MTTDSRSREFSATHWTLVLRARGQTPEARVALSDLCETYYRPVLHFLQREGRTAEEARDVAQEFFARILSQGGFDRADPELGRFRSYVLGALKHFVSDRRKHEGRLKRGAGTTTRSLALDDRDDSDGTLQIPDPSQLPPDALFDRTWALTVMARALDALEKELTASGKGDQFAALKQWLVGDVPTHSHADAARQLSLSEGAIKVAIHRLRKRFRETVRSEIAQTLREPSLVDEELQHLVAALS